MLTMMSGTRRHSKINLPNLSRYHYLFSHEISCYIQRVHCRKKRRSHPVHDIFLSLALTPTSPFFSKLGYIVSKQLFYLDRYFKSSFFFLQEIIELVTTKLSNEGKRPYRCLYSLSMYHENTGEEYWIHMDNTMYQVQEKYESKHPEDEWR